jgi:hypothetical protein
MEQMTQMTAAPRPAYIAIGLCYTLIGIGAMQYGPTIISSIGLDSQLSGIGAVLGSTFKIIGGIIALGGAIFILSTVVTNPLTAYITREQKGTEPVADCHPRASDITKQPPENEKTSGGSPSVEHPQTTDTGNDEDDELPAELQTNSHYADQQGSNKLLLTHLLNGFIAMYILVGVGKSMTSNAKLPPLGNLLFFGFVGVVLLGFSIDSLMRYLFGKPLHSYIL